ncbi:MAG: acyl-CoA/acyl-ACP dehydrogenase [Actinobacteria bacterium]|nr:acyl-CoA/acyl-ACP dehydrogenase [Actinomycetota bacterium]
MFPTEEQHALREMARDLFAAASPPKRLRALWDGEDRGRDVWKRLADAGLTGLTVPQEHGGGGGGFREVVLVLGEAGYAALPEPLLETVAVGVPLLTEIARLAEETPGGAWAHGWLERIAAGDAIVTVQLGGAPYVVDADVADLLLTEIEGSLFALTDFGAEPVVTEDRARRLFDAHAIVDSRSAVTHRPAILEPARDRGAVGTAALQTGIARRLLDTTVEYARTRQQFGQPIGAFQAVQHQLADVHVALTAAGGAVWHAAGAIDDDGPDRAHAAAVAKAAANDAASLANRVALQLHGGIGFTWEHDLHLWLKRGLALQQAYGSAREHRRRIAADLFDEESR